MQFLKFVHLCSEKNKFRIHNFKSSHLFIAVYNYFFEG